MGNYYIVNEIQVNNGTASVIAWTFDDQVQALSKYYAVLSSAVQSTIDMHGANLFSTENGGKLLRSEMIDRRRYDE